MHRQVKGYQKMIPCWFIVTWCDNHIHSYACVTLLFVQKAHKKDSLLIALYVETSNG